MTSEALPPIGTCVRITDPEWLKDHPDTTEGIVTDHLEPGDSIFGEENTIRVRVWEDSQDEGDGCVDFDPKLLKWRML